MTAVEVGPLPWPGQESRVLAVIIVVGPDDRPTAAGDGHRPHTLRLACPPAGPDLGLHLAMVRGEASDPPARSPQHALPAPLTPRELQVVTLMADGLTATAIGHRLHIAPGTVRKHVEHAYEKLSCHDRLVAVTRARSLGLLPPVPAPSSEPGARHARDVPPVQELSLGPRRGSRGEPPPQTRMQVDRHTLPVGSGVDPDLHCGSGACSRVAPTWV